MTDDKTAFDRNEWQREYYRTHPEYQAATRARVAADQKANPEKWNEANRKSWHKLRREAIEAYGGVCQCCGEVEYRFLTIDHINGDGAAERRSENSPRGKNQAILRRLRREGWPPGYQTLCWNCNCARHFNGGVCPHRS
ncbi:MAG TPA: hypothetical protein VMU95_41350 [Trebonia sp.]|nr:hypothetical protein [Trebonia sp.]